MLIKLEFKLYFTNMYYHYLKTSFLTKNYNIFISQNNYNLKLLIKIYKTEKLIIKKKKMYDLTKISVKMSWQLYFKIKIRPL